MRGEPIAGCTAVHAEAGTRAEGADVLARRLADAELAVQARDDFLAIAAHELRSPMNALSLQVAVLERKAALQPAAHVVDDVARLRRTLERYVRRATVLLDVTRLNADAPGIACQAVDVGQLVETVLDAHREEAGFHGCALSAQVERGMVGHWDPHMIEQVLANLVHNAIKYAAPSPVCIRASRTADGVRFEVSDQGPGIAPDRQARVFGKFERAVAPSAYQSGYGLGLWIVGRMVEAHHGTIALHSEPGVGTVFTVTLPLDCSPRDLRSPAP